MTINLPNLNDVTYTFNLTEAVATDTSWPIGHNKVTLYSNATPGAGFWVKAGLDVSDSPSTITDGNVSQGSIYIGEPIAAFSLTGIINLSLLAEGSGIIVSTVFSTQV